MPIDPTGRNGPTRGQAAGPRWRRVGVGLFVPGGVAADDVDQRIVEASAVTGHRGAVTGWAALRWMGVEHLDGREPDGATPMPIPLALGSSRARIPAGCVGTRPRLDAEETTMVDGLRVTTPLRALVDQVRLGPDSWESIVVIDHALASGLVSLRALREDLTPIPPQRELRALTSAETDLGLLLPYCSALARSPQETRLRLTCRVLLGMQGLLENPTVLDPQGRLLGEPDLLDAEHGVALEYDGRVHRSARQHRRDVLRQERFRDAGLEMVVVVGPVELCASRLGPRIEAARRRAALLACRHRVA